MSKFFQYTDSQGRQTEAEAYITSDYSSVRVPNSPVKLDPDGYLDPSLINPTQDLGIKAKTETFTLTMLQVATKKILLESIPVSTPTFLPDGGIPQRNTIDFGYQGSDNSLTWAGLGLEGFLEVGETVTVSYFYK